MKMTREYIAKEGLLEAYFLGDLSSTEEQEVFEILKSDSELMQQYKDLEKSMEKLAFENIVAPPNKIKEHLLHKISNGGEEETSDKKKGVHLAYKRYLAIAASIAALFMTASSILWFQLNEAKTQLKLTLSEQESLLDSLSSTAKNTLQQKSLIAYVNDPKTERHLLQGNDLAPKVAVLNYVNHEQQSVFIGLHNLPKLKDKDYQMWADVDGKMINMGVINTSEQTLAMNYIKKAESINITIEEKGGSEHPNVSQLIGSVSL